MQKTTKTQPFEKKRKTTSLQKTENLSLLRKNPLTKKHTILAEKQHFLFEKILCKNSILFNKKKPFQKNMNPSPGEKKRKKRTPLKKKNFKK